MRHLLPFPSRLLSHQALRRATTTPQPASRLTRHASSSNSPPIRLRGALYSTIFLAGTGVLYLYITDTRASIHSWLVVPALQMRYGDAEEAHHVGNKALKFLWQLGIYPRERATEVNINELYVRLFGHDLVNPIAISAGLDKDGNIPNALFAIGPSIVEIGGATPIAQDGNAKPRVFRLPSQNAIINRYGLNSQGADHMANLLRYRVREFAKNKGLGYDAAAEQLVLDGHAGVPPGSLTPGRLLAINIAKNKQTPDHDIDRVKQDYVDCVNKLGPYADILVVNVSSPNTPGLRSFQQSKLLAKILCGVVKAAQNVDRSQKPAVMVKVSPDEDSDDQIAGICEAVWESGVDGVIVGNTTMKRPAPLPTDHRLPQEEEHVMREQGGYSGPRLFDQTLSLVKRYRRSLDSRPRESEQANPEIQTERDKAVFQQSTLPELPEKVDGVQASVSSGKIELQNPSQLPDSQKQPLFRVPKEKYYFQDTTTADSAAPATTAQMPMANQPKIIFASGGIINGRQALDTLQAGASVAMIYTALVYGGVGTVYRIKDEMRTEIHESDSTIRVE